MCVSRAGRNPVFTFAHDNQYGSVGDKQKLRPECQSTSWTKTKIVRATNRPQTKCWKPKWSDPAFNSFGVFITASYSMVSGSTLGGETGMRCGFPHKGIRLRLKPCNVASLRVLGNEIRARNVLTSRRFDQCLTWVAVAEIEVRQNGLTTVASPLKLVHV